MYLHMLQTKKKRVKILKREKSDMGRFRRRKGKCFDYTTISKIKRLLTCMQKAINGISAFVTPTTITV